MRTFLVNVNGTSYEISVEEIDGKQAAAKAPAQAAPAAAPAAPAAAPKAGETTVNAPMNGNILDVKVKVGDVIKAGDPVVILEAMKMENEIPATVGGTVTAVFVTKGGTVEAGKALVSIA